MVKIRVDEDCGNAPKKLLLRDLKIAIANDEIDFLLDNLTDAIRWNVVGVQVLEGKAAVAEALEKMKQRKTTELTLANILTHGNAGSVDGVVTFDDGSVIAFCDVYRFSSNAKDAKIKEITSYVIAL